MWHAVSQHLADWILLVIFLAIVMVTLGCGQWSAYTDEPFSPKVGTRKKK